MEDGKGEVGFQSKSQSLRDKMKRRREAIQNLEASAISGTPYEPPEPALKKPKDETKPVVSEGRVKRDGKERRSTEKKDVDELQALLSMQSAKEKEERSQQEEILTLLSKPTTKELSLMDTFKSQDGGGVKEFCSYSTKKECIRVNRTREPCAKLHFVKIIQCHTDESLGDCSFLNTCFHMDTCKYIHYEVDQSDIDKKVKKGVVGLSGRSGVLESTKLVPPQWIQCDLRNFKFEVLGKFSVIMADPPWDIHMELPYGTMSDDEMRQLPVPGLQVGRYPLFLIQPSFAL